MISDAQKRELFLATLDWLRHVLMRHSDDFNFALVKIAYGDNNALGDVYGAPEALRQLSMLTDALQDAFRKSDMVARNGTDFWIIFPYTPFNENIYEKIIDVIHAAKHQGLNIVNREIAIFELPLIKQKSLREVDSGLALLHYLKENQAEYASHIFTLAAAQTA